MLKNRAIWIVVCAIFINLFLYNKSFAIENGNTENVYPDFSYEFVGKDPCERFNRKLFMFNLRLNRILLRPVNTVWASVMPKYGMDRFKNLYKNMNYPIRLMGCLLQKDFKASGQETIRFLTNTTIGLGGLFDPAATKFKIEPRDEDIEQALAHFKIKEGPYLVLPVVQGNLRDLAGKLLDCPLRPTAYVGPFGAVATALFAVNNTTYMQPMIKKVDESYADPYEIAKQVDGIAKYIKIANLDRSDVFKEKTASQNFINISKISENPKIKADIELEDYNPQGSLIDSTRTSFFDNQKLNKQSMWSDMSVWNRSFDKKIKIASVKIIPDRANYRYKYILQKNKTSPLAIIYPSIGEGIMSDKSVALAKILFDEGYSVIIQGSSFHWEFIKSMPQGYKPGLPAQDAQYIRLTTSKIIENLQKKKGYKFDKRILVGCSYGALTGIFTAAQEENDSKCDISKYICINPPIEIFFSLKQLDKYCGDWKKDPTDMKLKTAIAARKIMQVSDVIYRKEIKEMPESMPFTEDEAKLIIGFVMKQKLYDVVFAIENGTRSKKSDIDETVDKMSFDDYAKKYLFVNQNKTPDEITYETGIYSLANFLQKSEKYKIYETLDDYFLTQEQLIKLKKYTKDKSVIFSNGSHLGCMYRKEFLEQFIKDIKLEDENIKDKV